MPDSKTSAPAALMPGGKGQELWAWLDSEIEDIETVKPLAEELCVTADRLQEVRTKLGQQGLMISGARGRSVKNPMLDAENKLSRQYTLLWRSLGLSDKLPEESKRLGRPPGSGLTGFGGRG